MTIEALPSLASTDPLVWLAVMIDQLHARPHLADLRVFLVHRDAGNTSMTRSIRRARRQAA